MKRLVILLLLFPMFLGAQQASIEDVKTKFDEPGNAYRGKPFWSWNGELEEEELIRQVHVLKEMGMGGFFMHSRTGLKTEYQHLPGVDVLVVNPVESLWSQIRIGWADRVLPGSPEIKKLEQQYVKMFNALQGNQIDFDYGDEEMMTRYASVDKNSEGVTVLKVGKTEYQTVVFGGMTTMRSSTLELLKKLAKAVPFERGEIAAAVREFVDIPLEAIDGLSGDRIGDILCQVRQDGDRTVLVAMNVSRDKSFDNVKLKINNSGIVTEWDCETGDLFQLKATKEDGSLVIPASFAEAEEHVYTITPSIIPGSKKIEDGEQIADISLSGPFEYTLDEPNLCVLDLGYLEIEGKEKSELMEILQIDERIRDHYGLEYRGENILVQEFEFRDDLDLEALYLLGDFSVSLEGDKKILGELPEQIIAWKPNKVEITDNLEGVEELALEVVLTRRNSFGPLHHIPFAFVTAPPHFISKVRISPGITCSTQVVSSKTHVYWSTSFTHKKPNS